MTKQRSNYIYRLVGRILEIKKRFSEKYPNDYYYQLITDIENKEVNKILALPNKLENEKIWQDLEDNAYLDKKYVFLCKNYMGSYRLINWELLENHESN